MPHGSQSDRVNRYAAPSNDPTAAVLNAAKIVEFGLYRCGTAKSSDRMMTAGHAPIDSMSR